MEVHHHPDIEHKPKHFKEYFLEFLMIFLAVTMGFIAENIREHFTERSKEREYIHGFISNVETDTARLADVLDFDHQQLKGIDSFLMLAHAPMKDNSNRESFYHLFIKYFYNSASFKSSDATLQQLKNTGDYRLIIKNHAADSLAEYDAEINGIYTQGAYYEAYFKEIIGRLDELVDMTVFRDTSYIQRGKFTGKPLPPLNDTAQLRVLFNKAFDFRIITSAYADNYLAPELDNPTRLFSFLKTNEYDIAKSAIPDKFFLKVNLLCNMSAFTAEYTTIS